MRGDGETGRQGEAALLGRDAVRASALERARGGLRRGAQEAGGRTQYGRGKAAAAAAAGMAADHPIPGDRALAGQRVTQPAARRGLPGSGQRLQAGQQTEYERENKRMGPIQLRHALSEGGEAFGQGERLLCYGRFYN